MAKERIIQELEAYQCLTCFTIYEQVQEAGECCPGIKEVKAFKCPECDMLSEDFEEATECCG